jgi:hypothetical protein
MLHGNCQPRDLPLRRAGSVRISRGSRHAAAPQDLRPVARGAVLAAVPPPAARPPGIVDDMARGGTLVVFLSDRFPHEVLPARRERLSLAGWFRRRSLGG